MKDTRTETVNIAEELIRSIGYNAFSYADISKKLNIKNAAIHYYFPTKADLGVEVIKKNIEAFNKKTISWNNRDIRKQLTNYITLHDSFTSKNWVCIVGSLSPSFDTLPEVMQKELQKLVTQILAWLTSLLTEGKDREIFTFSESPRTKAFIIHSALLSALQMNKVLRNDVYKSIQEGLLNI